MERHQWKNGDIVRLKEDNGKRWQISKTNDTYEEWFISEIRECGLAGGWVSTWTLYNKYEFVNNPIDDAQEAIKKEFDKIKECVKESSWSEEDEEMVNNIIDYMMPMPIFFVSTKGKSDKEYTKEFIKKATKWLISIKERLKGE